MLEQQGEYSSEWATIGAIAGEFGFTADTLPLEQVDGFNNRRLSEPIRNIPPAKLEKQWYQQIEGSAMVV